MKIFRSLKLNSAILITVVYFLLYNPILGFSQNIEKVNAEPDTTRAFTLFQKTKEASNYGNYDSTELWLRQALPLFKSAGLWQYQVRSYHILSGVYYRTGKADLAGQFLDTALQVLTVKTDSSDLLYAPYYHNRATVFYVLGNYPEAKNLFLKAIGIYNTYPDSLKQKVINSYNNLGLTYNNLKDYENAISYFQECLNLNLKYNPGNKFMIARAHNNIGIAYFYKGAAEGYGEVFDYTNNETFQRAEMHYRAAIENYLQVVSPPNIALGQSYLNLANVMSAKQDLANSIKYRKKALWNFGEGTDNPFFEVPAVYYNTAIAYKILGQLDSARFYVNKAIDLGKTFFGEKHYYLSDYYNYLGRICMEDENYNEALVNFQQSIIIACISFNDTHYASNPEIEQVLLKDKVMQNFAWKAMALKHKYSISHDINDLELAVENYYLFNDLVKITLSELSSEETKLDFMEGVHENYGDMMELCYQLWSISPKSRYVEDALYFSENDKSTTLSTFLDNSLAKIYAGMSDEEIEEQKMAHETMLRHENDFMNLRLTNETDSATLAMVSDSLLQARYNFAKIELYLNKKHARYAAEKNDRREIHLGDIQKLLGNKEATVVEYFLMDTALYSIVINQDYSAIHKESIDSTFFDQIADYRKSISDYHFINRDAQKAYEIFSTRAHSLYNALFPEAIKPAIGKNPNLVIIPNGELNYLSFDCLLTTDANKRKYKDLDYLSNGHIVSYANAIRYINFSGKDKNPDYNYAGFAPEYDQTLLAELMEPEEYAVFRSNPGLLREHTSEVEYAGKIFGGDAFVGTEANELNFKKTAGDYNILHFAMHALINDENPLSSKFLFTLKNDNSGEDNFLNTYEIYGLDLNARLVVLSACNTASGILRKGEGVMSLSRAFMYSGVSSIVSSLWLAEDHSANQIISGFFDGVNNGLPLDAALSQSRKNYLQSADPVFSHPYYWANFILIGDNSPIDRIKSVPYKTIVFGVLMLVLVFVVFFFSNRKKARS